jgi:hypothetical protein
MISARTRSSSLWCRCDSPEQVAAVAHLHACAVQHRHRLAACQSHVVDLRDRLGRQPERGAFERQHVESDQRRNDEDARLLQQHRSRFVHQIAVFDRPHACFDRALNGARGVGVRHHVGLPRGGLVDDGPQLVHRVAGVADGIVRRGHAAARHHLDLRRTLGQLLAGCATHLVDAVHDTPDVADTKRARAGLELVAARAEVAVAACLRKCLA